MGEVTVPELQVLYRDVKLFGVPVHGFDSVARIHEVVDAINSTLGAGERSARPSLDVPDGAHGIVNGSFESNLVQVGALDFPVPKRLEDVLVEVNVRGASSLVKFQPGFWRLDGQALSRNDDTGGVSAGAGLRLHPGRLGLLLQVIELLHNLEVTMLERGRVASLGVGLHEVGLR